MSSIIKVDTIDEKTPTSGVTIDGVLLKDGEVDGVDVSAIVSGSLVKLASATASNSASLTFDNFVDQNTYNSYQIMYKNIKAGTDGASLEVIFREGGASGSTITGTYRRQNWYSNTTSSTLSLFSNTATDKTDIYQLGNSTREELSFISYFYPANGTNGYSYIRSMASFKDPSSTNYAVLTTNLLDDATSCTGLLFQMSSGNIVSGTIDIYGVKS
jgi:hypothetical protein